MDKYSVILSTHIEKQMSSFSSVFGYLETFEGESVFIHSDDRILPADYDPREEFWYTAAIEIKGNTVVKPLPYMDEKTHKLLCTYLLSHS